MAQATASPRRTSRKASSVFVGDRVAGLLALVLDIFLAVMLVLAYRGDKVAVPGGHAVTLTAVTTALTIVGHLGILRGLRWGFLLSVALSAWGLFNEGVPSGPHLLLSTNLWMLAYGAFRLGSAYGPRLR